MTMCESLTTEQVINIIQSEKKGENCEGEDC